MSKDALKDLKRLENIINTSKNYASNIALYAGIIKGVYDASQTNKFDDFLIPAFVGFVMSGLISGVGDWYNYTIRGDISLIENIRLRYPLSR
jgi:hypothetical protein